MSRLWSDADSAALDREVRESRKRERRERLGMWPPSSAGPLEKPKRRKRPGPSTVAAPPRAARPRRKPNGRWVGRVQVDGRNYERTFDTRAEAERFIADIKGGK